MEKRKFILPEIEIIELDEEMLTDSTIESSGDDEGIVVFGLDDQRDLEKSVK